MPDSDLLRIQLLGGFQVRVGRRPVDESSWRLRKARTLIKLLALAPGRRLHRDQVVDALWPDLEPESASNNLHQALHVARRAIGASRYLQLRDEQLSLAPSDCVWIDVDEFETAAAEARRQGTPAAYATAFDQYAGELLPEDRYEDWAAGRRDDLSRLYNALLGELAHAHAAVGAHEAAIASLRQLLGRDRTNEQAHVQLMRELAVVGRGHEVVRQYHQLRQALRDELGVEPSLDTE